MERIVNAIEENPNRENSMKVWKDYTIEDAIVVIEKAVESLKPKTIKPTGENRMQLLCKTSQDLQHSQSRKS